MCDQFLLNDRWFSHKERQSVAVFFRLEFLNSKNDTKLCEFSDSAVGAAVTQFRKDEEIWLRLDLFCMINSYLILSMASEDDSANHNHLLNLVAAHLLLQLRQWFELGVQLLMLFHPSSVALIQHLLRCGFQLLSVELLQLLAKPIHPRN